MQKVQTTKEEQNIATDAITLPTTHTVLYGESLWTIAIEYFNSGYNWVDIADANALINPDYIEVGQKLIIPDVEPKIVEAGQISAESTVAPKHTQVTVVEGDTLWDIAEREYGSGYKWTSIAQQNNITTPNLIYPATVLRLE